MAWLNIDIPTKTASVHVDTCAHAYGNADKARRGRRLAAI